jgi:putative ABC transport system substrate-binding protein
MQFGQLERRKFTTLLGVAALASPLAARAQQPAMPVIGLLSSTSMSAVAHTLGAFRRALSETGYSEGRNVTIEYRWADGKFDQLPAYSDDLIRHKVAVIVTFGGEPAALAAKAASSTTPIVFGIGGDPVKIGLVDSLNRPSGNATGISLLTPEMGAKQLEMLLELVPRAALIGVLVNPDNQLVEAQTTKLQEAAQTVSKRLLVLHANSEGGLDSAFATLVQNRAEALVVITDPFFLEKRDHLVSLSARHAMPTIFGFREFASAGGLMSYGSSPAYAMGIMGNYTGRILKGERPGNLPVWQAVKIELVLNLKTAGALGLTMPPTLLARADEVIE